MSAEMIMDTHVHLWDTTRFNYPWLKGLAALEQPFLWPDYAQATQSNSSAGAVFMECAVERDKTEAETRWALGLSDDNPLIRGVVAGGFPEEDDFPDYLRRIAHPRLKGIRRVLLMEPEILPWEAGLISGLQHLGDRGLTFDLCVYPRQLPLATRLVRSCPATTFILDHCGIPPTDPAGLNTWRTDIGRLGKLPNVFCKFSGLRAHLALTQREQPAIQAIYEEVRTVFGPSRLIYASDWPVCLLRGGMLAWLEAVQLITATASKSERAAFFHSNAIAAYRLS